MIKLGNNVRVNENLIEAIEIDGVEMTIRTSNVNVLIKAERDYDYDAFKSLRTRVPDAHVQTVINSMYRHQKALAIDMFNSWADDICSGCDVDTSVTKEYKDDDLNHKIYFSIKVYRPA